MVIALSGPNASAGQQASRPALTGQVVDAVTGLPLAAALVELSGRARPSATIGLLTDDAGRFRFEDPPASPVSIQAKYPGYDLPLGERLVASSAADGSDTPPIRIELVPRAVVTGLVTDPAGRPLESVVVSAVPELPYGSPEAPGNGRGARTNDLGEYRISLAPGRYRIVVRVRHHTQAVGFRGAAGAGGTGRPPQTLVTSRDGRFFETIDIPPAPASPGSGESMYISTAFPSIGWRSGASVLTVKAGDRISAVDIRMLTAPRVQVSGVAYGPDGPLSSTILDLFPADVSPEAWEQAEVRAETAPDGTFTFLGVPPGTWILAAYRLLGEHDVVRRDPLGLHGRLTLTVGERNIDNVAVLLTPGVTLRAQFGFNGSSPRPARVQPRLDLRSVGFRQIAGVGEPVTDDEGFVVSGLAPGQYNLTVRAEGGWAVESVHRSGRDVTGQSMIVEGADIDDVVVTLTDRPARVTGRVAPTDLDGMPEAHAIVFSTDGNRRSAFGIFGDGLTVRRVPIAPDGGFDADLLPPGEYFVVAVASSSLVNWSAPSFLTSLESAAERVLLPAGMTRSVTVQVVR